MMVWRIVVLLAAIAAGWYAVSRLLRPSEAFAGDDMMPAGEHSVGLAGRVSETATGAVEATRRAAQAPMERIRSIVGDHGADPAGDTDGQSSAASVPVGEGATDAAQAVATIKGNINRNGEKIYHMPGDPAYEQTKAEQMFTSIEEAEAAGFRRAGQRQNG